LPLALFGPEGYGERQGLLMVPARIAQAFAPLVFGYCLDRWGAGALWLSCLLSLAAFGVLMTLPRTPADTSQMQSWTARSILQPPEQP
jgi:MFS family permease